MAEVVASKLKLLHLARIFERETDDDHGLTAPQIIGKLAELGVNVERKTLYRDIDCLRAFGYNILKYNRAPVEYGLAARFQAKQELLLADAVQSSKFNYRKAESLPSSKASESSVANIWMKTCESRCTSRSHQSQNGRCSTTSTPFSVRYRFAANRIPLFQIRRA